MQPFETKVSIARALIAVGSNKSSRVGDVICTVNDGISALESADLQILAKSRFFRSPAFPENSGPDYINAAISVATHLSPVALLERLHTVEATFGRTRETRWAARTLDLDLIDYNGKVLPDPETQDYWRNLPLSVQKTIAPERLILPHPRVQDRAFVLIPLKDVVKDWVHPVTRQNLTKMCNALPSKDIDSIRPVETR